MKNKEFNKKSFFSTLGFILIIAAALELIVFNFRSIESVFFEKVQMPVISYSDGTSMAGNVEKKIKTDGNVFFEIKDINADIHNIKIDAEVEGLKVCPIIIAASDEGNAQYKAFPEREVVKGVNASKFIKLNLAGNAKNIKVELKGTEKKSVTIHSVGLNEKVPVTFSFFRLLFVWFVMALFYTLRPSSFIYGLKPDEKHKKVAFAVFLIINILIIFALVNANPTFKNPGWEHHKQYHSLAESLAKGQFHLDAEPNEKLLAMENPYDYTARGIEVGTNFLWDHAYYEGNYYVYFGIVPCLLFYLPVYIVSGSHMPTYIVIFITASLSAWGIMLVLREIMRKKFPDTPYAIYLLLCEMLIVGGGLWMIAKRPDFYFVPICTAIMLTLFGIYFWLTAKNKKKLNCSRLAFGSLLMALVAGARPQFLLASFFMLVIFADSFKEKKILSKQSYAQTAAVAVPYIIVAAFLMYYNFARFGSPFDFGANYNLTLNDMTLRGIRGDRSFVGWFSYLFQPPFITTKFPFVQDAVIYTAYQGTTITEEMFGGFLMTNPFAWFGALAVCARKYFEDKKQLVAVLMCAVFTIIIVFVDTQMAGILMRYVTDFALLLCFGAAIAFAVFYNVQKTENMKKVLISLLVASFAIALIYNLLLIFVETGEGIRTCNPELYYNVKYLTAFWN